MPRAPLLLAPREMGPASKAGSIFLVPPSIIILYPNEPHASQVMSPGPPKLARASGHRPKRGIWSTIIDAAGSIFQDRSLSDPPVSRRNALAKLKATRIIDPVRNLLRAHFVTDHVVVPPSTAPQPSITTRADACIR